MSIWRHQLSAALRELGNAEVLIGAYNSSALSIPGAAVDPAPGNTGNGTVGSLVGKARAPSEVITLTALTPTTFSVVGSLTGALGTATVGTPFTSAVINLTITAGGSAFVAGDNFTITVVAGAGTWRTLGAKEGPIQENLTWRTNELKAEEHTGGIPHQAQVVPDAYNFTIPIIFGEDDLWSIISPTGSGDGFSDNPVDVVTTSMFLIPRSAIPDPGGLSYDGTSWSPSAPDKRCVFIPRMYLTPGAIGRPYENMGKSIVDVTVHPMWHSGGPSGKRVFVRGGAAIVAAYPDFRL